ncbi:MAG: cytochrome b/b6 domain-containing protein [Proteobacteria bacterium]|nr:cytochrome b/b6 domain-containing protein [Pseudomonadota bacterium]
MSKLYLHTLSVRIWHWVNAFIVLILIITGIQLRAPSIQIFHDYRIIVLLHKYFGFAMAGSFLFWLFYNLFTGNIKKHYIMSFMDMKNMPGQAFYYLFHIFRGKANPFEPSPESKFNPLQKLAYSSIMLVFVPIITFTGIMFSDILFFFSWIKAIGGLRVLDAIHVAAAYVFVLYLFVHIYMSTLGSKFNSHIKCMVTGYEEK